MEILLWLLPISFVLLVVAGGAFMWAVNTDQFEDLDHHAMDIFEEDQNSGGNTQ